MNDALIEQWGAFGAILLAVGLFALRQTLELSKAKAEHIADAKLTTATAIAVIKDFAESAREQVRSQTANQAVNENTIETLERLDATFKRVEDRIGTLEATLGKFVQGRRP